MMFNIIVVSPRSPKPHPRASEADILYMTCGASVTNASWAHVMYYVIWKTKETASMYGGSLQGECPELYNTKQSLVEFWAQQFI